MALFLVQHGRSAAKEVDPAKGLTDIGREETKRIAEVAKGYRIQVRGIVHSGKNRAEQTAAIFQEALKPPEAMTSLDGIDPLDDVRAFAATIEPAANRMVVGHLPFMERLVSYLIAGSEQTLVCRFQNSGIVCLDQVDQPGREPSWHIKWTLNPNIS